VHEVGDFPPCSRPAAGPRPKPAVTSGLGAPARTTGHLLLVSLVVTLVLAAGPAATATASPGARSRSPVASDTGTPLDPKDFAPGACEAFSPTIGNRHRTVFLDAGHGGIDPGGVGSTESGATITEAAQTLPTELDTMALLRSQGFRVVVSRTRQTTVVRLGPQDVSDGVLSLQGALDDVAARDECANLAKADILIGIYYDAGASPDYAGSISAYDLDRPFAAQSQRLATLVQTDVLAAMNAHGWQIPDDGVLPDNTLGSLVPTSSTGGLAEAALNYDHLLLLGPAEQGYFSTPSDMPGTVVEPLYVTDPFEGTIAASTTGQQAVALGIDQAVLAYFAPGSRTTHGGGTTGPHGAARSPAKPAKRSRQ
jgi:N-acetylmuramoyl-L-alanine amidase